MIRISVSRDGSLVRKYTFKEERVVIGRDPECNVRVDNVAVSRQHAAITKAGEGWEIQDLQSGNGTFVNDSRVTRQALESGQTIVIGKFALLFEVVEGETDRAAEAKLAEGATFHMDRLDLEKLVSKTLGKGADVKASLVPAAGGDPIALNKPWHFAGSAADCTVPASGAFVAKRIAVFLRDGAGYRLVRIGGSFGKVAVNGAAADSSALQPGDKVDICGRVYEYSAK